MSDAKKRHRELFDQSLLRLRDTGTSLAELIGPVDAASVYAIVAAELLATSVGSGPAALWFESFATQLRDGGDPPPPPDATIN